MESVVDEEVTGGGETGGGEIEVVMADVVRVEEMWAVDIGCMVQAE